MAEETAPEIAEIPAGTSSFDADGVPSTASITESMSYSIPGATRAAQPRAFPEDDASEGTADRASEEESRKSGTFVDPAPFVGIRQTGPSIADDDTSPMPGLGEQKPTDSGEVQAHGGAARDSVTSHPLARMLNDLASRIERREIEVGAFEEGMTPEASVAALLAAMLKRAQ